MSENKKIISRYIQAYESECNNLVKLFIAIYDMSDEWDWIGGEIGGVVLIGDMAFSIEDIKTYLEIHPDEEEMYNAYEAQAHETTQANLKNWLKYPSMRDSWKR